MHLCVLRRLQRDKPVVTVCFLVAGFALFIIHFVIPQESQYSSCMHLCVLRRLQRDKLLVIMCFLVAGFALFIIYFVNP